MVKRQPVSIKRMTDSSISRYLLEHRANDNYTHVSCIRPLGRYGFDRKGLEGFLDLYCQTLFENPDMVVGIAQIPREYSMVVVDGDIKKESIFDPTRLYTYEQIEKVIKLYQNLLRKMVVDVTDDLLHCVLLEKEPYRDGKYIKSGFHLAFVNLFLPKAGQDIYLSPKVKEEVEKQEIFTNVTKGDVLDLPRPGAKPKPWLMYGSRKSVTNTYYKVTKVYKTVKGSLQVVEGDKVRDYFDKVPIYDMSGDEIKKSEEPDYYYPRIFSIHPEGRKTCEINGVFDSTVSRTVFRKDQHEKISREEDDDEDDEDDTNPLDPSFLKEIESLVEMLSPERAVTRDSWIEMGWILYSITKGSQEGLKIWMTFSAMCPEQFSEQVCMSEWSRMYPGNYTIKTLRYMAGIDSPDMYMNYQAGKIKQHIMNAVDGSHNDIAKAMYEMYSQKYICASIKPKMWFMFNGNNWVDMEEGVDLRSRISSDLVTRFIQLCSETQREMAETSDEEKSRVTQLDMRVKSIQKVIKNLKSSTFKNSVMKECEEVFYDPEFLGKLGKNKYLIAFQNGVYDLKLHCLRKGRPEDYLTLCMPQHYVSHSLQDGDVIDVLSLLEKIFPDESVRKYFVDTTAEIFIGGNKRKLVQIWTGEGNNGKSIIKLLLQKLFGKYIIDLPTSVLVGPRTKAGSACPELARAGRGVRWVVAQEPNVREEINIGVVKELSGNDSFFIRTIYDKGGEIQPLFKITLICLAGDTKVTLSSGLSISIEKIKENHRVLGYEEKTQGMIPVNQTDYRCNGEKECVEITLLDGRKIVSTPDHKFMTSEGQWIEAQDIKPLSTELQCSIYAPNVDDMFESYDYILKVGEINYDCSIHQDRVKAAALCRILGAQLSDGSLNRRLYAGHQIDVDAMQEDIYTVIGKIGSTGMVNNTYYVNIPTKLGKILDSLTPVQKGGRVHNPMSYPEFVFDPKTPLFLVREFIAGLYGGDGIVPCVDKQRVGVLGLVASKDPANTRSLIWVFSKLSDVLRTRFGIRSTVSKPQTYTPDVKGLTKGLVDPYNTPVSEWPDTIIIGDYRLRNHVFLQIHKQEDKLKFGQKIGFRYSCQKASRMTAIVSFLSYRQAVLQQNQSIINRGKELLDKYKRQNPKPKIVQMKKDTTDVLNIYDSTQKAQHATGIGHSEIKGACDRYERGSRGTSGGYTWRFEHQIPEVLDEPGCEKLQEALDQAIKETTLFEPECVVSYSQFGRYIRDEIKYKAPTLSEHLYTYFDRTGLRRFLNNGKKISYAVSREDTSLPTFHLPVISVRNVGIRTVYDLTIEEPISSFLAEGTVTHNCNKLPRLPSDEQAIWNRIRVIPFEAVFTNDYPEDPDEQLRLKRFPKDELLEDKLEGMAEAFGWYLLDTLRRNQEVKYVKEPPKVLAATEHYRKANDVFAQYIEERLVRDDKNGLTVMQIFTDFKDWHRLSFPGFTIPIKQDCYEYLYSRWGPPSAGFKWMGWRVRTDRDDLKEGKVQTTVQQEWGDENPLSRK